MKTNVFVMMTALLFMMTSCTVRVGEGGEKIEPSEKIVKETYQQDAFSKVENHVVGKILLVQSKDSTCSVTLSAPENYVDLFDFHNEDGNLIISFAKGNFSLESDSIMIIVHTPNIAEVTNTGAAEIRLKGLQGEELNLNNSGVGAFQFSNLVVRNVNVRCTGVGSIKLNGRAGKVDYKCTGVGNIEAKNLKARRVEAHVSGVGGIDCYASEYFKGHVSGVGKIRYAGHPKEKELNANLTGSISEL
jgi:hypothetical protein